MRFMHGLFVFRRFFAGEASEKSSVVYAIENLLYLKR